MPASSATTSTRTAPVRPASISGCPFRVDPSSGAWSYEQEQGPPAAQPVQQ
jgi:hypothetical protein